MQDDSVTVRRSVAILVLVCALIVGGLVAGGAIVAASGSTLGAGRAVTLKVAHDGDSPADRVSFADGFAPVVEPVLPTVVNISTSKIVKVQGQNFPFFNDPFFRQFFGDQFGRQFQGPQEQREHSLGSGVIVSPDGYILTNNHVVAGATDIRVSLKDKREFKAKVIGTDPRTDLAVIKIPATGLAAITLGDSSKLRAGDFVLAIGEPFGLGYTVTMGIVSATQRNNLGINPRGYEDYIQTDAAINPGNSGGALINVRGELVGINTAILTGGGGGNEGIGFAIPVDLARHVMEQIIKTGKVTRGYLGIIIQEVTPDLAKAFGLPKAEGALVGQVEAGGPAAKAGLEKGDVILALNGQPISDFNELSLRVADIPPGQTVKLEVWRSGQKREVNVTLTEYPESGTQSATGGPSTRSPMNGVDVQNLTPDIAQQLGLPAGTRGVVVTDVDPNSPAADVGLQRGDVIQEVNRKPVNTVTEYERAIREAGNQQVLLLINHGGVTSYLVVSPR